MGKALNKRVDSKNKAPAYVVWRFLRSFFVKQAVTVATHASWHCYDARLMELKDSGMGVCSFSLFYSIKPTSIHQQPPLERPNVFLSYVMRTPLYY